jgi:hypothetical protein
MLDDFKDEHAWTYSMTVEIYTKIKENIENKAYDERLALFKQYDVDENGFINKVTHKGHTAKTIYLRIVNTHRVSCRMQIA